MTSHVVDSYVVQNDLLQLRIIEYAENGWVAGAYYLFECAPAHTKKWRRISSFRFDDPLSLPRNQARFVSDKIAYIFLGWEYAVTTDGGENWSVWTAPSEIQHFQLIQDVDLQPNGSGTMRCGVLSERHDKTKEQLFETADYGRTWNKTI